MVSIIVPTLGTRKECFERLVESLENQSNVEIELIVVSQENHDVIAEILENSNINVQHIKIDKKGLSIARNEGMKYVKGNIVTFGDDDCWYPKDIFNEIEKTFDEINTDVVCFNILDPIKGELYKAYKDKKIERMNELNLFKVSSIEIYINLDKVNKENIIFDEKFGLGAIYKTGEENILMMDLHKKGYKITYLPKIVVYHLIKESNEILTPKMAYCKGAAFKRMFSTLKGLMYINLLIIKHRKKTKNLFSCILDANKGFLEYEV